MSAGVRIAMWSGPRTISTAMMRAWENRADCQVVDEPLYAYYLQRTGLDHPGRAEILRAQPTGWPSVVTSLTEGPMKCPLQYQKHMTHHLLPEVDRLAFTGVRHAFLIRDPADLLVSYAKVRADPTLADLGLAVQVELFERFGGPVLDSGDLLENPPALLAALCRELEVPFDQAMLSWPSGPRDSDGVWARHWYDSVRASTGFTPPRPAGTEVPNRLLPLLEAARPYYDRMAGYRLRPA